MSPEQIEERRTLAMAAGNAAVEKHKARKFIQMIRRVEAEVNAFPVVEDPDRTWRDQVEADADECRRELAREREGGAAHE